MLIVVILSVANLGRIKESVDIQSVINQNVVMLIVVKLSAVLLPLLQSIILQNVSLLSVIYLSGILLIVVLSIVVAPKEAVLNKGS
jgi:hypothetical protein